MHPQRDDISESQRSGIGLPEGLRVWVNLVPFLARDAIFIIHARYMGRWEFETNGPLIL